MSKAVKFADLSLYCGEVRVESNNANLVRVCLKDVMRDPHGALDMSLPDLLRVAGRKVANEAFIEAFGETPGGS
jgi:hypothetical protein